MEPVDTAEQNQMITNCQLLKTMDASKITAGSASFTAPFKLAVKRDEYIHALVAYFDIDYAGFSVGGATSRKFDFSELALIEEITKRMQLKFQDSSSDYSGCL
ncbi:protein arginine N-methyltransferase 1.1 [Forsythia ovata]|uniref:Protein arginine N-methyltransferase 1.1 n=1 Tax=Forsythia ovata TaxID=205694 RepID=A0ABD1WRF6_9LAMI